LWLEIALNCVDRIDINERACDEGAWGVELIYPTSEADEILLIHLFIYVIID
jgi:hypothetical protein